MRTINEHDTLTKQFGGLGSSFINTLIVRLYQREYRKNRKHQFYRLSQIILTLSPQTLRHRQGHDKRGTRDVSPDGIDVFCCQRAAVGFDDLAGDREAQA